MINLWIVHFHSCAINHDQAMEKNPKQIQFNQTVSFNNPKHQTIPTRKTTCHQFLLASA